MKRLPVLLAAMFIALPVFAQPRALTMIGALHAENTTYCGTEPQRLESFTPGLGIGYDINDSIMVAAGAWRTSQASWSPFAIADYRPLRYRNVSAGVFGGLSGGYCLYDGRLGLIGGLTVRADDGPKALHLFYVPKVGSKKNEAAIGIGLSFNYGG